MVNIFESLQLQEYIKNLIYKMRMDINPRGRIVTVIYSSTALRHDTFFYFKKHKRFRTGWRGLRRMALRHKKAESPILQYHISGYCLAYKASQINSSVLIRNVLNSFGFELRFPIFSPAINMIGIQNHHLHLHYQKSKRYILRKLSPRKSVTKFAYVLYPLFEEDLLEYAQHYWK